MVVAIYPGSFDPLTNGHVDIIHRGARLFDRIVVGVLINLEKAPLFTVPERVAIAREVFHDLPNVEVDTFDGLLVDYARRKGARVIVRGGGDRGLGGRGGRLRALRGTDPQHDRDSGPCRFVPARAPKSSRGRR